MNEIQESASDSESTEAAFIARAQIAASKFPSLGPAIWLLSQSPEYADLPFKVIDQRFLPPIILDQYRIFLQGELPIAFATWACLSDEVLARFKLNPQSLEPHEWQSGLHKVLVDFVAPFGGGEAVSRELQGILGEAQK